MEIRIEGLDKFIASVAAAPASVFKQLRTEMKIQLGLIGDVAKSQHNYHSRTGTLQQDLVITVDSSGLSGKIQLDTSLPYAASIHDGSKPHVIQPKNGKALVFVNKQGKRVVVLENGWKNPNPKPAWMFKSGLLSQGQSKDDTIWSHKGYVMHPGTKLDPFLYNAAAKQEPDFINGMEAALRVAFKNVGL
jgi:hypothetical protein